MSSFFLISDLHVDRIAVDTNDIVSNVNGCRTAVVAGDISDDHSTTMQWLIKLKNEVDEVIWVPGNHDFYNAGSDSHPSLVNEIQEYYKKTSDMYGLIYLNRESITLNGITFIGATGWHDFVAGEPYSTQDQISMWAHIDESSRINWNYSHPKELDRVADVLDEATKDFDFISAEVKKATNPVVVVTHHLPHRLLCTKIPNNIKWTKLHGMFVNTMFEHIIDDKIKYWCYGHTHFRSMKDIGGITYVCNPKGYKGENPSWQPVVLDV